MKAHYIALSTEKVTAVIDMAMTKADSKTTNVKAKLAGTWLATDCGTLRDD